MDTTRYLKYDDAALRLSVTPKWLRRAVAERRIPFHKFGRLVRFDVRDLDEFAQQQRVDAAKAGSR